MPTVAPKKRRPARGKPPAPVPANPWPARLKALRDRLGLSIARAAFVVGVKPSTWYGWETPSQNRQPSPSHAILIDAMESGKLADRVATARQEIPE